MNKLIARIKVILTAFPTYASVVAVVLTFVGAQVAEHFDGDVSKWITKVVAGLVAVIGAAIAIVRRVTTVLPEQRGILPQADAPAVVPIDMSGPTDKS